jgi:hypothetical protein
MGHFTRAKSKMLVWLYSLLDTGFACACDRLDKAASASIVEYLMICGTQIKNKVRVRLLSTSYTAAQEPTLIYLLSRLQLPYSLHSPLPRAPKRLHHSHVIA